MNIRVLVQRKYAEGKITKPKILKGRKPDTTIEFIPKKCTIPVYKTFGGVIIHHKDFFSSSISIPDAVEKKLISPRKKKFIYNDNFGSVVLRNEAWLDIYFGEYDLWTAINFPETALLELSKH